jgi:hypothetical protein
LSEGRCEAQPIAFVLFVSFMVREFLGRPRPRFVQPLLRTAEEEPTRQSLQSGSRPSGTPQINGCILSPLDQFVTAKVKIFQ